MDFPIVDADTHVNEPPELWEKHLVKKFRDRAPRVVDGPYGGKAWACPNGRTMGINMLTNSAGVSPTAWELLPKDGYDSMRPGGWDPKARLGDMDIDMVDIHVLFPSYAFLVCDSDERDLHVALIRAYNDWASEFCTCAPDRLYFQALIPTSGLDDAVAEAKRARELPGISGLVLKTWPNGKKVARHAEDDAFWSTLEDLDLSGCCHVGFNVGGEAVDHMDDPEVLMAMATLPFINQEKLAIDAMPVLSEMILGGVLERHPRLRFGLVEVGVGWIPFFMEQSDDNYMRHRFWTNTSLSMPPSEYWGRQCFATFQVDPYGIENRQRVGVDTIMWSSDYPHAGADWPYARERIGTQLRDVPDDEQRRILSENAMRFYGIQPGRKAKPNGASRKKAAAARVTAKA
jgi:predicted TIM-barrel fold metal-dependent hydrolase